MFVQNRKKRLTFDWWLLKLDGPGVSFRGNDLPTIILLFEAIKLLLIFVLCQCQRLGGILDPQPVQLWPILNLGT